MLASQTDEELRPEARTYRCGRLTTTIGKAEGDELNEKRHKAFVLVEAEMVVHHLAETLTRLFIVHAARPPIAWISMMQLRGQGEFKRQLEHVLSDSNQETLRSEVGWVFLGSAEQPEEEPDDAMPWNEAVDRIAPYLDHFGRVFLNRAEVYNAAKHGLTMQPGDTAIELVGVPELAVSGPSLAHLAYGEEDGERVWVVKNRWLDVEQELALASVGYHLIDALWTVARIRYTPWPSPAAFLSTSPPIVSPESSSATIRRRVLSSTQSRSLLGPIAPRCRRGRRHRTHHGRALRPRGRITRVGRRAEQRLARRSPRRDRVFTASYEEDSRTERVASAARHGTAPS